MTAPAYPPREGGPRPTVAELVAKHGTLADFERACVQAIWGCGLTADEVREAVRKYREELEAARRRERTGEVRR